MSPALPRLPYAQVRPQIRSGDLLLCAGSSPFSKMIQAATGSPYSHVGFVWRLEGIDRILVLESVESIGVRCVPLASYVRDYSRTGKPYPGLLCIGRHTAFPAEAGPLVSFAQQAVDLLGTAYDHREIAAIALRIVAAKLGLPAPPLRADTPLICSEFVQLCLGSLGTQCGA